MAIIVSNCQHCDEQQFQTLSFVHHTILFSVVKLVLFMRALLLDRILALEKTTCTPSVHLVLLCTIILHSIYLLLINQSKDKYLYSMLLSVLKQYQSNTKNNN